ncbi:MAG: hypothetical protein C0596_12355, partial [Marinilabiliales bacterium]
MSDFTKSFRYLLLTLFLGIVLIIPNNTFAQLSEGGTPVSFELSNMRDFNGVIDYDEIVLRPPNVDQFLNEDVQSGKDGTPPRVGTSLPISASKTTAGNWTDLPDGGKLWTLKIHSEGATALSVFFDDFHLAPGSKMFFYNENRKQVIGAFTHNNNKDNGTFATEMVQGETIYIEYYEPKLKRGESNFHIASVGYFYKELYGLNAFKDDNTKTVNASDACEVNINCSPVGDDWQDEKRGVAQITFLAGGSWYLCSGTLINNTAYDATPYFLTAFHCGAADVNDATELPQWVFKFIYESPDCNDLVSEPSAPTLTGCTRVADGDISGGSDFFLLLLDNTPTAVYEPYYNGCDISGTTPTGVGIHHPSGDIKKISTYGSITPSGSSNISGSIMAANSSWTVGWVSNANGWGVTEGGSSGSPLFNSNGLQIGTLTGGSSYCTDQTATDIYGRFSYHWDQNAGGSAHELQPWLDPSNTTTSLPGYDPFATAPPVVDFEGYPTTVIQGSSVDFYNYTVNSPTSHDWTFENGTPGTSTDINPTGIVYNTIGTHDVTLTSSNVNCPSTLTKTDYIEVVDPSSTFCDTISQFCCSYVVYTSAGGYVAGTNEYDITEFAEKYTSYYPYNQITGARFYIADADNGTSPDVTFNMYDISGDTPGSVIATQTVPLADVVTAFNNDGYIDVNFPSAVDIPPGGFFLGIERPGTPASGDTLALLTNGEDGYISSAYTVYEGAWYQSSSLWGVVNFQYAVFPFACYVGTLPPVADFTGTPTRIPIGSTVQFNDESGGTPATAWDWTFEGGTPATSTDENPLITYNTLGFFDASLEITNGNGTDDTLKVDYIEVFDPSGMNAFSLDWEACNDFQLDDFLPWTTNDVDGSATYAASAFDFTNEGYTGSFIAFNSGSTTPEATGWEAHGGSLCGVCFAASTPPNNDWLISDQITLGNTSSFVFWAKSITDAYGLEQFNVLVSTTDNQPASFNNVSGGTISAPLAWTEFTYDLSAYDGQTVYIAVQCVSNDAFAFMIDDIEILTTYPPPTADFVADQTNVPMGTTVNFTDLSTSATSWDWTFTGGTPASSTLPNPSIVYNTIGTYPVSLTVNNSVGTATETKTCYITVTEVPDVLVLCDFPNNPDNNIADDGIAVNLTRTIAPFGGANDIQYANAGVATRCVDAETWSCGSGTKGWEMSLETTGYGSLKLSYAQMSAHARSPRDFKIQYSLDGVAWVDLGVNITLAEAVWYEQNGIPLPAACENQANVYIRWIMTSDFSTDGSAVQDNQSNKRNAMDNVLVTGLPLNAPPVASFSSTPTTICEGESVTFTDGSTNTPTSWSWTFDGGTPGTSAVQDPVITYNTAGTYQVELTATNAFGSDTDTQIGYITVNPLPVAPTSVDATLLTICEVQSTDLTYTGGSGDTFNWYTGSCEGTLIGTGDNFTVSPTTTTTYYGAWENTCGVSTCLTVVVTVNPLPVAPTSVSATAPTICITQSTDLTYTGGSGDTFNWYTGSCGGTLIGTGDNFTVSPAATTTYYGAWENTCGVSTCQTVTVTVNPLPAAAGTIVGTNTICKGVSGVGYSVPAIANSTSYVWTYTGTGVTINGAGNAVTLDFAANATSGNLTVYGTNACGDGTVSANYAITVNPLPDAAGAIAGSNTVCQGATSVAYNVPSITNAANYVWAYSGTGATITGTSENITIDFATNATSGDLTVYGVNPCGNGTISANYTITVDPLPAAAGVISGSATACQNTTGIAYTVPAITDATSYVWAYSGTGATINGTTDAITIDFDATATSGN